MARPRKAEAEKKTKKKVVVLDETNIYSVLNQAQRSEGLPETKKPLYLISLAFGDKVFEGSGATVLEALRSMPVPVKIVSKGLLKLTDGTKKMERMWQPAKIKRLFFPLAQTIQAKQLAYLMK